MTASQSFLFGIPLSMWLAPGVALIAACIALFSALWTRSNARTALAVNAPLLSILTYSETTENDAYGVLAIKNSGKIDALDVYIELYHEPSSPHWNRTSPSADPYLEWWCDTIPREQSYNISLLMSSFREHGAGASFTAVPFTHAWIECRDSLGRRYARYTRVVHDLEPGDDLLSLIRETRMDRGDLPSDIRSPKQGKHKQEYKGKPLRMAACSTPQKQSDPYWSMRNRVKRYWMRRLRIQTKRSASLVRHLRTVHDHYPFHIERYLPSPSVMAPEAHTHAAGGYIVLHDLRDDSFMTVYDAEDGKSLKNEFLRLYEKRSTSHGYLVVEYFTRQWHPSATFLAAMSKEEAQAEIKKLSDTTPGL